MPRGSRERYQNDAASNLQNLTGNLSSRGYSAIRTARSQPGRYDLALLDVMPGIDGYETAQRLRTLEPGLPVIGQIAHAMAEDLARCLQAGRAGRVVKPLVAEELVRAVRLHARPTAEHKAPARDDTHGTRAP